MISVTALSQPVFLSNLCPAIKPDLAYIVGPFPLTHEGGFLYCHSLKKQVLITNPFPVYRTPFMRIPVSKKIYRKPEAICSYSERVERITSPEDVARFIASGKREIADCPGVRPAFAFFQLFNDLHRADFWST